MNKLILVGYISMWAGIAINSVGKVSEACGQPYTWSMPIVMVILLSFPAILGYLAAKEEKAK